MTHELFGGIDPGIVSALGLDDQEIDGPFFQKMEEYGKSQFKYWCDGTFSGNQYRALHFLNLEIYFTASNPREIPDAFMHAWDKSRDEIQDEHLREFAQRGIIVFLESFARAALNRGEQYLETAINAFDLATVGGIMQNQEVLDYLKQATKQHIANGNPIAALNIVKILQGRTRKVNASS